MNRNILQKFILGCDPECIHSKVVIAPCWSPQSVGVNACRLISKSPCEIWECIADREIFTYIVCGPGASFCADIVMALENTRCSRLLFLGSSGSLDRGISIGDIGIPAELVSGEGASRYIQKNVWTDLFGKRQRVDEGLHGRLSVIGKKEAAKYGVGCFEGAGISVDSIFSQYQHISCFQSLKCSYIDMEASAFAFAAAQIGASSAVVFCISDNVAAGEPLYAVSEEKTCFRKEIRRKVMPQLIRGFLRSGYDD